MIFKGYTNGTIADYLTSTLAMTLLINSMDQIETIDSSFALAYSGEMLDLSAIDGIKVDKHSAGGVGGKMTLIVDPTRMQKSKVIYY